MNWLNRIAVILITLSITLAIIAVIRGSSPETATQLMELGSFKSVKATVYLTPRDLRLRITTSKDVNLSLTDPSNQTIISNENFADGNSLNIHIEKRGTYTILLYNPYDTIQNTRLDLTVYNFEADIIQATIVLAVIGVAFMVVNQIWRRKPKSHKNNEKHMLDTKATT